MAEVDEMRQSANGGRLSPEAERPALAAGSRRGWLLGLAFDGLLLALIAVGVYFRFSWMNWNQGTNLHPDEYGLTSTISRLSIPTSLGDYFNTRQSSISPYDKYDLDGNLSEHGPDNRMRWGQWPITLIRYAAELTGNTGYDELRLLGRRLSALADTLALVVTFLIGWELYGRRAGLLAAALSALAVMQIQQAHFMTVDTFALLFTVLAMYAAVRAAKSGRQKAEAGGQASAEAVSPATDRPADSSPLTADGGSAAGRTDRAPRAADNSWLWYALFGVFFGMTLASRINLLPLAAEIAVAAVIAYAPQWTSGKRDSYQILADAGWRLALAGVVAFVTFRVTQPMTFRAETGNTTVLTLHPNADWLDSMKVAQAESNGQGGGPPGEQWTNRPALVFPWVNMVVWGMGLPLGLLAWAGFAWAAWRSFRDPGQTSWRRHVLPLTWAGGYFLFMGTRWVKSIRYFLPIYPFMVLFAAWALVELWQWRRQKSEVRGRIASVLTSDFPRLTSLFLGVLVLAGTLAWAWGYTSIYRHTNTRLQATRWIFQNVPAPLNLKLYTGQDTYSEPLPAPFGLTLGAGDPYVIPFVPHVTGTTTGLTVAYATSPFDPQGRGTLRVVLAADPDGRQVLAQTDVLVQTRPGEDERGSPYNVNLPPAALVKGEQYYALVSTVLGGPIAISGSTVANENWDEGLPVPFDGRDPFGGLYRGLTMEVHWVDNQDKRQMFLDNLALTDYIILPSQRRLWSSSRLPNTYPMTMEYYRALFDGRLGFDLVAQFQSPFVIGPLEVSDLAGTWAWGKPPPVPPPADAPFNFNLLAAEEAFSVYDHAPVWIFKKRADFDLNQAAAVLDAVDLSQVVVQGPHEATNVPTLLRLPADRLAEQRAGGTWSAVFNFDGLLNRHEWLGVIAWYLAVFVLGLLAFPLTFAAFGGLADRGYPLARTVSLLVATWIVWMLASFRVLPFTRGTVALGFGAVALISAIAYWPRRAAINAYLREQKRHLLIVEGLALALFAFDLLIRLGNPDLWHPNFGGEKPMVFSFFNAVLKSTSFPPYNPWLAGYYLNYYYYGFVIVAMLTKLLAIVPAFAYNLILPTLFSLTGINAFCAAYNLVESAGREAGGQTSEAGGGRTGAGIAGPDGSVPAAAEAAVGGGAEELTEDALPAPSLGPAEAAPSQATLPQLLTATPPVPPAPRAAPHASPYLGGIAAALLVVVLGNLGQVRTFLKGFQGAADHPALASSVLGDNDYTATVNGFWRVATGQTTLALGTGQWYWDATRITNDIRGSGNDITEFPFFTFLYADLHAHMIDMPFTLLSLAWAVSYVLGARRRRGWAEWVAVFALGGLALGVPRAANTWDFPLYLILGALAVVVGEWVREPRVTRATLFNLGWRVLLLAGLAFGLYRPFDHWFAAAYSQIKRLQDGQTPLTGYLYVHGLFLFILVTFLAWETRRWLAETPARVLSHAEDWLAIVVVVVVGLLGGLLVLLKLHVAAAWVALPVMLWAGLLLLRGWTAMPMAKRLVLFLTGTALAMTLFVDLFALEGDRMNTIFKFYIQVWVVLSVAAGAALAWVWATLPEWRPSWRGAWTGAMLLLFGAAALYTVTASAAKLRDRFPSMVAAPGSGCAPIAGMALPYDRGLPPEAQPHSLYGLDYMTWSAYCDHDAFLPLVYDHEAIRWMQDHVLGSPVIAEAQSWDLYRMSSRYAWNTGLPDVVGWDYHTRQHNAAIPTEFVTQRGREVEAFYLTSDLDQALDFIRKYAVSYVIVGPMEQAYYGPAGGLAKFDALAARGDLRAVFHNGGVTIYQVASATAASQ